ncbi:predicted protein, partial [Ostreococcus lucimarinus CCE9901]
MCPGGASNPCSRNGLCDSASGSCFCNPGYVGSRCNAATIQRVCSGRLDSSGSCVCLEGWSGVNCTVACAGTLTCKCGDHGRCNALSGECECDAGYAGELCERLIEPQPTCANGGTWNAALKRCECAGGYTGTLCDAACTTNPCNDLCSGHGTVNVDGTSCTCFTGFSGSTCN